MRLQLQLVRCTTAKRRRLSRTLRFDLRCASLTLYRTLAVEARDIVQNAKIRVEERLIVRFVNRENQDHRLCLAQRLPFRLNDLFRISSADSVQLSNPQQFGRERECVFKLNFG